ncbi:MAG: hypothetical protein JXR94_12900, partial [Candidatus Hydrogenedentes bacterium]|nr:hypothetical protein [Candidatus Hydrogenedentota bacterium]
MSVATDMLLGIDLGTTVLKVCAFDARSGATLGQAARRLAVHKTPDGGREQRPGAVDRAFSSAAAELRGLLGARWGRVAGIGLAAQGGSSIIADRRSGKASTPMILWNDGRTRGHSSRLAGGIPTAFWRERVLRDFAPTGLGRLLWLKEERPELFRHDTIHAGAGEYLFFKMTGVWRQDAGNAIQIGSFNAATKRLDPALFDLVGVPLSFVAPLRQGHETAPLCAKAARSLELPTGIPVAGPYIDQEAGYLSACAAAGRPLQCSLGTAWVGNYAVADDAVGASPYQLVLPNPA